mmetsp:Transcript_23095/g.56047  ORF Transcript_23095/g.56047 Transcript_23095/m.56047 type:complete len:411 (+) Transcript_23095:1793-3025(+)
MDFPRRGRARLHQLDILRRIAEQPVVGLQQRGDEREHAAVGDERELEQLQQQERDPAQGGRHDLHHRRHDREDDLLRDQRELLRRGLPEHPPDPEDGRGRDALQHRRQGELHPEAERDPGRGRRRGGGVGRRGLRVRERRRPGEPPDGHRAREAGGRALHVPGPGAPAAVLLGGARPAAAVQQREGHPAPHVHALLPAAARRGGREPARAGLEGGADPRDPHPLQDPAAPLAHGPRRPPQRERPGAAGRIRRRDRPVGPARGPDAHPRDGARGPAGRPKDGERGFPRRRLVRGGGPVAAVLLDGLLLPGQRGADPAQGHHGALRDGVPLPEAPQLPALEQAGQPHHRPEPLQGARRRLAPGRNRRRRRRRLIQRREASGAVRTGVRVADEGHRRRRRRAGGRREQGEAEG